MRTGLSHEASDERCCLLAGGGGSRTMQRRRNPDLASRQAGRAAQQALQSLGTACKQQRQAKAATHGCAQQRAGSRCHVAPHLGYDQPPPEAGFACERWDAEIAD